METQTINPDIQEEWKEILFDEFQQPYFAAIRAFLLKEKTNGKIIYPPGKQIFNAFNLTPLSNVKVVILGQDPYHGRGQAHGLSFSVPDGIKPPPSLVNIFKEIKSDTGATFSGTGNLEQWAKQGVLLLNAILTVEANQPASHREIGWEKFTNSVISAISEKTENVVFLLWGKFAGEKAALIDTAKHLVLKSPHPSPFSADRGFFGCKHFSRANDYLVAHGKTAVNWSC